jgi:DNA-binding response OmpR family regulator
MTEISRRVLVVDDEPCLVDALATSLRYEGFSVREAFTGRSALALAHAYPPDLVIVDVTLPDLDGLEVTRRLRADGLRVPILFLSARDTLEDKLAGLSVGGDDYVTKPFALVEVIARVRALLRRGGFKMRTDVVLRTRTSKWMRTHMRCIETATTSSLLRPSSLYCATFCSILELCFRSCKFSNTSGITISTETAMSLRHM